jgi:hypothetical protein
MPNGSTMTTSSYEPAKVPPKSKVPLTSFRRDGGEESENASGTTLPPGRIGLAASGSVSPSVADRLMKKIRPVRFIAWSISEPFISHPHLANKSVIKSYRSKGSIKRS